jgi:transglutaminase-like putative cysteine protease
MHRSVSSRFQLEIEGSADIVLSVAVAGDAPVEGESLEMTIGGIEVEMREVRDDHHVRLHCADGLGPGRLEVAYHATVVGPSPPPPVAERDLIRYARPSRYCESDRLSAFARAEFRGLEGLALLDAVSSWVGMKVAYLPGSSRPIDGAVATLLARQGVCRDFAHLTIALLRGCDTPARLVSVYAPGLQPMDFHAVAEAYVDDRWLVADATALAPRSAMVRIATGRDAADTAFLSTAGARVAFESREVMAVADPDLPVDDMTEPAQLR